MKTMSIYLEIEHMHTRKKQKELREGPTGLQG